MSFDFSQHWVLFGGSFNPPHPGHTEVAKTLLERLQCKRLSVIPSWGTPLKTTVVPYETRLKMTEAAFQELIVELPSVDVSSIEGEHQIKYTWQLLEKLKKIHPDPLLFVAGTDQFRRFDQWAHFPEFLSQSDWLIVVRKPESLESLRTEVQHRIQSWVKNGLLIPTQTQWQYFLQVDPHLPRRKLIFFETDAPEISSSEIRELYQTQNLEKARSKLIPAIADMIERNHLYGT